MEDASIRDSNIKQVPENVLVILCTLEAYMAIHSGQVTSSLVPSFCVLFTEVVSVGLASVLDNFIVLPCTHTDVTTLAKHRLPT